MNRFIIDAIDAIQRSYAVVRTIYIIAEKHDFLAMWAIAEFLSICALLDSIHIGDSHLVACSLHFISLNN